jgi:beta-N-acetylhexosaminidase
LQSDFYPFKMLYDAPMGMVAHLVLSAIDDKNPATESKTVINEIIRKEIGFKGLLVSDAIMMNALKGSISERAKRVFEAGCEVICLGNSDFKENQELCDTGLVMSDSALEKLKKIVEICKIEPKFENYANVQKKYCEMQKNIISYEHKYDATEVLNRLNNKQEV